jgi:hypothetical protein
MQRPPSCRSMWGTTTSRGSDVQPANLRRRFLSAFRKCSRSDVLRVDEDVKDKTDFCWESAETDVEADNTSRAKREFSLFLTCGCRTYKKLMVKSSHDEEPIREESRHRLKRIMRMC